MIAISQCVMGCCERQELLYSRSAYRGTCIRLRFRRPGRPRASRRASRTRRGIASNPRARRRSSRGCCRLPETFVRHRSRRSGVRVAFERSCRGDGSSSRLPPRVWPSPPARSSLGRRWPRAPRPSRCASTPATSPSPSHGGRCPQARRFDSPCETAGTRSTTSSSEGAGRESCGPRSGRRSRSRFRAGDRSAFCAPFRDMRGWG
jgi:hypothetical protein